MSAAPANTAAMDERNVSATRDWLTWQRDVVAVLRRDLAEALPVISLEDVDWPSWQRYFLEGHSPQTAVNRAFERDL